MEKSNVNTLRDLVEQAAAEYGDKTFLKEKAGKEIVEKTFNDMLCDTRKVSRYLLTEKSGKAKDCIACGQCESVCPQHLSIIELLAEASGHLDKE